jgi:hypothetical protein
MHKPSRSLAGSIWPLAMALAGAAHAAPFDERIQAPKAATAAPGEIEARLRAHFETFDRKQQESEPGAFIRDRSAHKQWVDLYFSITRAMDEGRPLANLAAFGLVATPEGQYTIDLKAFPQWDPLDARLFLLSNPDVLESYVPALEARGFRDADVDKLRTYVGTHDPRQLSYPQGRQLFESYAKRLQKRKATGRPPAVEEMLAFRYQKDSIRLEAERQWAVGLLDALDDQRQRILVSFFDELKSERIFGAPSEPLSATLEKEIAPLVSGEYARSIAADESQLRRDIEHRAEKLIGGQQQ